MSFLLPLFMATGETPPPIIVHELSAFRSIAIINEPREVYIAPMDDFVSGSSSSGTTDPENRTFKAGEESRTVTLLDVPRSVLIELENRLVYA